MSEKNEKVEKTDPMIEIPKILDRVSKNHPNGLTYYGVMEASEYKKLVTEWKALVEMVAALQKEIAEKATQLATYADVPVPVGTILVTPVTETLAVPVVKNS